MLEIIVSIFILLGAGFALIASIGVVRMPDTLCRLHAATKAGAFGLSLMLLALVIANPSPRTIIQSCLIILFFYLTAPIAAHLIGRLTHSSKHSHHAAGNSRKVDDTNKHADSQTTDHRNAELSTPNNR
ncbi:MAG: monovalent cation/H(+) antiporter subunit G [Verrucomicrobiota bacterium]